MSLWDPSVNSYVASANDISQIYNTLNSLATRITNLESQAKTTASQLEYLYQAVPALRNDIYAQLKQAYNDVQTLKQDDSFTMNELVNTAQRITNIVYSNNLKDPTPSGTTGGQGSLPASPTGQNSSVFAGLNTGLGNLLGGFTAGFGGGALLVIGGFALLAILASKK